VRQDSYLKRKFLALPLRVVGHGQLLIQHDTFDLQTEMVTNETGKFAKKR